MLKIKQNNVIFNRKHNYSSEIEDLMTDTATLLTLLTRRNFDTDTICNLFDALREHFEWVRLEQYSLRLYNLIPPTNELAKKIAERYYWEIVMNVWYMRK